MQIGEIFLLFSDKNLYFQISKQKKSRKKIASAAQDAAEAVDARIDLIVGSLFPLGIRLNRLGNNKAVCF